MRRMEKKTQDVVAASSVIPDLSTAVQEAIYNSLDGNAKSIKVTVDLVHASFSVTDDGVGIDPDGLYEHVGECCASAQLAKERVKPVASQYGTKGMYLWALASLAHVEIESRVQDHWTSHRKVIQEGQVLFNARSKVVRKTPGTALKVRDLFRALPVRQKDLECNRRYRLRMAKEIQSFCTNMSLIWPKLAIDVGFTSNEIPSMRIYSTSSCRERFTRLFGDLLGRELKYHSLTSTNGLMSIRGYVALVQDDTVNKNAAWNQAKSYYQFVFFRNQWIGNFHHVCAKYLNQAALDLESGIPIFVLKISCDDDEYDIQFEENGKSVLFRSQEQLQDACFDFMHLPAREIALQDVNATPRERHRNIDDGTHSQEGSNLHNQVKVEDAVDWRGALEDTSSSAAASSPVCYYSFGHDDAPGFSDNWIWGIDQKDDEIRTNCSETVFIDCLDPSIMHQVDINDGFSTYQEELLWDLNQGFGDDMMQDFEANMSEGCFDHVGEDVFHDHSSIVEANWSFQNDMYDEVYSSVVDEEHCRIQQTDMTWESSFHACKSCGYLNTQRLHAGSQNDPAEKTLGYEFRIHKKQASHMPIENDKNEAKLSRDDDIENYVPGNNDVNRTYDDQLQCTVQDRMSGVFFEHSEVQSISRSQNQAQGYKSFGAKKSSAFRWISSESTSLEHDQCDHQNIYQDNCDNKTALSDNMAENVLSSELIDKPEALHSEYLLDLPCKYVTSSYFAASASDTPTKNWSFTVKLPQEVALRLRVDNIRDLKDVKEFKLSKSIFKQLQVIRQVDRKFILVTGRNPENQYFLMCVDQHAADERIRLEKFEEQVFGSSGRERNVQVHIHEAPLVLSMNYQECETLLFHEGIVRSWGFDFKFLASETSLGMFSIENANGGRFLELRMTPKIDSRVANAEDFREYIRLLSQTPNFCEHMRPPVITKFLHSRACRTAIMFGDWLSVSQCQELIQQLQYCKLPFQCAHGRPSIVPLVEFLTQ